MSKQSALTKRLLRATIIVVLLIAGFGIAQMATPPVPPAEFFPEGALVYIETRDAESLLEWWKGSRIKADWEQSDNYRQFQNSRLYLKLRDRLSKWGSQGSFQFHLDNLIHAAGDRSALALYDIGELKGLAATRVSFAEAKTTQLWLSFPKFEEKKSGERTYYKEPNGTLSFAYAEPYLIVASEESLLVRSLSNMDQPVQTLNQSSKWQSLNKQPESDVSLFLDQEALQQNRYFKKYWIHQNVSNVNEIRAAWINLSIAKDALIERRYFLRSESQQSTADGNAGVSPADLFTSVPYEALYIDTPIAPRTVAEHILKLVNRLPAKHHKVSYPPTFTAAAERATQAESKNILLEQIDAPILEAKAQTMLPVTQLEEIEKLLAAAGPQTQIRILYPLWDNHALFVRFEQTSLLQLKNPSALDKQKLLQHILDYFLLLHSIQDEGARWTSPSPGSYVLESFRPLYLKFDGPWIVISTNEKDFRTITSHLPKRTFSASYREVQWKTGRWKYTRLMQRLDHGEYQEGVPLLFSQNIASLLSVLDPIHSSSITQTPTEEIIRYEVD